MNSFSGSTILWSILGEYEPFNVLLWQCMGLLSGSYGPKIGQNCMKYDILGTFRTFSLQKRQKRICFLAVLIYGDIWENISPSMYFSGSVRVFEQVIRSQNVKKIPDVRILGSVCTFPRRKKYKLIHFLAVLIYGDFWENMNPFYGFHYIYNSYPIRNIILITL